MAPKLRLRSVSAPDTVAHDSGSTTNIGVTVENVGSDDYSGNLAVVGNGEFVRSNTLTVKSGQTESIQIEIPLPESGSSGNYILSNDEEGDLAAGPRRPDAATFSIRKESPPSSGGGGSGSGGGGGSSSPPPAEFQVANIDAPSGTLDYNAGESLSGISGNQGVKVDATFENVGGQDGTKEVVLIGQGLGHVKNVSVPAGGATTETFHAGLPDAGGSANYRFSIDSSFADNDFSLSREGPPSPADFTMVSIDAPSGQLPFSAGSPRPEVSGERAVAVDATFENVGDQDATKEILLLGNGLAHARNVSIPGGSTTTETFYAAVPDGGSSANYEFNLTGDDGLTEGAETPGQPPGSAQKFSLSRAKQPATLSIDNIAPPSGTVAVGDPFSIDVTVTNTGQLSGSREVSVPGETQSTSDLAPGESETVTLEVDPPSSGGDTAYTVETEGGATQQFTVAAEAFAQFQIVDINAPDVIDPEEYPAAFDV